MSNVIRTSDDGWGVIPELKQASKCLGEAGHEKYEIDSCVRLSDLDDLVSSLRQKLQNAIYYLDAIDTDVLIEMVADKHETDHEGEHWPPLHWIA